MTSASAVKVDGERRLRGGIAACPMPLQSVASDRARTPHPGHTGDVAPLKGSSGRHSGVGGPAVRTDGVACAAHASSPGAEEEPPPVSLASGRGGPDTLAAPTR